MDQIQDGLGISDLFPPQNRDINNAALLKAAECGNVDRVRILLAQDEIDVNVEDEDDWTALIWASDKGYVEIVELLLAQDGIDVNAEAKHGWTPLLYACCNRDKAIVDLLLAQEGVDINAQSDEGSTPLILAAHQGYIEIVDALLAKEEINVNATDTKGWFPRNWTALKWAAINRCVEVAKVFLERKVIDPSTFTEAASGGNVAVETLFKAGIEYWTMKVKVDSATLLGTEMSDATLKKIVGYANKTLLEGQNLPFVVVTDSRVIEALENYLPTPSEEEKADLMRLRELPFYDSAILV